MFGSEALWNRDLDRHFPELLFAPLSRWTRLNTRDLRQLHLASLIGTLFDQAPTAPVQRWVLPLGIYHRKHRHHGYQYCPSCLSNPPAYMRKRWRLACITECLVHRVELLDSCPSCDSPVQFHRAVAWPNRGLACSVCGGNFLAANPAPSHPHALWIQTQVCKALDHGWLRLHGSHMHSLAFMQGLKFLSFGLTTNRHTELRRDISRSSPELVLPAGEDLELMRVGPRRMVLRALAAWLRQWPELMLSHIENSRTLISTLRLSRCPPPFWVIQALDKHPSAQIREVSQGEIDAAVAWLRSLGLDVTKAALEDALEIRPSHKMDGALQTRLKNACLAEAG